MSFISRLNVSLWCNLMKVKHYYKAVSQPVNRITFYSVLPIPPTVGFSLFTWLGFDKKTAEDELIHTIKYSILFIQRNEYEKAERLLHVALRQAQQIQNEQGITYIYDVMANLALQKDQLDKANSLFVAVAQRVMASGATEDDLRIIHLSTKLARVNHLKKEYDIAKLGYEWCLNKLEKEIAKNGATPETTQLLAMIEDWYGRLYAECNQVEKGVELMIGSLKRMRNLKNIDKEHIAVQLNDIGTFYEKINKYDESIEYIKEAIENAKEIKDMEDLGALYVNLGKIYIKKNMLADARKNCGYGYRLGKDNHKEEIQKEAASCLKEIDSV